MIDHLSKERLALEIKEMVKSYRNVALELHPSLGPIWHGYVKRKKQRFYFFIRYPREYPSFRPYFYPIEDPRKSKKIEYSDVGLHTYHGEGVCLYTHDSGPDSWNEDQTATDCVRRYIEVLNGNRNGILDYQDLYDRLTMPGFRSYDIKYVILDNDYSKLKELKQGEIKFKLMRKNPELYLATELISSTGEGISIGHSWFDNDRLWEKSEVFINGNFMQVNYKEIDPNWSRKKLESFLKVSTSSKNGKPIIFHPQMRELLPVVIERTPKLANYELQIFDTSRLFNRVNGVLGSEREILSNKTILLIGLGSIGSKIALALAKAGVGNFFLYDPDILLLENIVRHTGDMNWLYQPKVEILESQIDSINPDAVVKAYKVSPLGEGEIEKFRSNLTTTDLVICSVAIHEIEEHVNRDMVKIKKPAVYVSALGHASFGRIFRVFPFETACFSCIDMNNQENPEMYPTFTERTGSDVPRREGYREGGVPGIGIDIDIIANLGARMALQTIFYIEGIKTQNYPESEGDHLIWANQKGWISDTSLVAQWLNHSRNPNCMTCSNQSTKEEKVSDEEFQRLLRDAADPQRFKRLAR